VSALRRLTVAAGAVALLGAAAPAAEARDASAAAKARSCLAQSAKVGQGRSVRLRLDCAIRTRGKRKRLAVGRRGGARRSITKRPRHGRLRGLNSRSGVVRYIPRGGFSGRDGFRYRVRLPGGRRLAGLIRIRVTRAKTPEAPTTAPNRPSAPPAPTPVQPTQPAGDGLPPRLPPAAGSVAFTSRNWQPGAADTCPREVHERFSVIGPDGKRYPGWHPPSAVDPATKRPCTFGHEHGRDPRGSDLRSWVTSHFALPGRETYAGIPFGQATEALDEWAAANPGTAARQEDHVGYKVDYENDVPLRGTGGQNLGVTCDYLVRVHQGSHSPDALNNNVHELLYASRCSDGTELISNTVSRFGDPGEYSRGCDPDVKVPSTDNGFPDGEGDRLIPDRTCMETNFLVPAGRTTSVWASYEKWSSQNQLRSSDGGAEPLASFSTAFGVFNPSRYGDPSAPLTTRRTHELCWEVEANGDKANGVECDEATEDGAISAPYSYDDARSPFNGTYRDFYVRDTQLRNSGGSRRVWTDPYGGNASPQQFPGAVCQLVATSDTPSRPEAQERVFGRNRTNEAPGVHAPN